MKTLHCKLEFDMVDMHPDLTEGERKEIVEQIVAVFKKEVPRVRNVVVSEVIW